MKRIGVNSSHRPVLTHSYGHKNIAPTSSNKQACEVTSSRQQVSAAPTQPYCLQPPSIRYTPGHPHLSNGPNFVERGYYEKSERVDWLLELLNSEQDHSNQSAIVSAILSTLAEMREIWPDSMEIWVAKERALQVRFGLELGLGANDPWPQNFSTRSPRCASIYQEFSDEVCLHDLSGKHCAADEIHILQKMMEIVDLTDINLLRTQLIPMAQRQLAMTDAAKETTSALHQFLNAAESRIAGR